MSQTIQSGILPNYKHKFRRIKSLSWRDLKPFIQYPCNPSFPGAFQWECFWSISLKSFLDIITSSSWSRFESSDLIFESHSVSLLSLLWTLLVPYVFFFFFFSEFHAFILIRGRICVFIVTNNEIFHRTFLHCFWKFYFAGTGLFGYCIY